MDPDPAATMFPAGDPIAAAEVFAAEQRANGYLLDFSLTSLQTEVDRLIELPMFSHGREREATDTEQRSEASLGAYIGETLRRLFGGEWIGTFHPRSTLLNFYRSYVMFGEYRFEPHLFIAYRLANGACEGSFRGYLNSAIVQIKARTEDDDPLVG